MNANEIIIKPILTEKTNKLTEKSAEYVFKVHKKANKLEIKKAVETFYNVKIEDVRTIIVPSKLKVRMTKKRLLEGRKQSYKKAVIKVAKGETIDFYTQQ